MLKIIEFELKSEDDIKIENSLALAMNDFLMQYVNEEYKEYLSMQMIKPYTQYIIKAKENIYHWQIATLNQEATENIAYNLMDKLKNNNVIKIEKLNYNFEIQKKGYIHNATYKQLVEKYFTNRFKVKYIDFIFLTPTMLSVESNIIYEAKDILMNLVAIWNLFSGDKELYEPNLINNLAEQMYLDDYEITLKPIKLDGKKNPIFYGKYRFRLNDNIMANKIILLLAEYAKYTGIGQNTHLGMGAVNTRLRYK